MSASRVWGEPGNQSLPLDEAQDPHEDSDALDLALLFALDIEVGAKARALYLWRERSRKVSTGVHSRQLRWGPEVPFPT